MVAATPSALGRLQQWNSTFFAFSIIIEGTTEKAWQFTMPLNSYTTKIMVSVNKKVFLNTTERFKQENMYQLIFIFVTETNSDNFSRAALYRLMLVLHKDAIFH